MPNGPLAACLGNYPPADLIVRASDSIDPHLLAGLRREIRRAAPGEMHRDATLRRSAERRDESFLRVVVFPPFLESRVVIHERIHTATGKRAKKGHSDGRVSKTLYYLRSREKEAG